MIEGEGGPGSPGKDMSAGGEGGPAHGTSMVLVPRLALEIVLDAAESYTDERPSDEGWKSSKLTSALEAIRRSL